MEYDIQPSPARKGYSVHSDVPGYAEGEWTPRVFVGPDILGGQTYSLRSGNYIKIGKTVIAQWVITLSNKGSDSGEVNIGNIPYDRDIDSDNHSILGSYGPVQFFRTSTAFVMINYLPTTVVGSTTHMRLQGYTGATTTATTRQVLDTDITSSTQFSGTFIYKVT